MHARVYFVATVAILLTAVANLFADGLLQFGDQPIGYVVVSREPWMEEDQLKFEFMPTSCQRAAGKVLVEDDAFVGLELIGSLIRDPSSLSNLSPLIRSISISGGVLTREHVNRLTKLPRLVFIDLHGCEFTADAFDDSGPLNELKSFAFSGGSIEEAETSLANWLAKQSQLERLICSPQLSASSLKKLVGLQHLRECHATLAADAPEIVDALKRFPALRSLNVVVRDGCSDAALANLGAMKQLTRYRQVFGSVSRPALLGFAQTGQLQSLDLALVSLTPEDVQAIGGIQSLESLDLLAQDQSSQGLEKLASVCLSLPKLRGWPRLANLSSAELSQVLSRRNIERLSLSHIQSNVDLSQLNRLAELTSLRELKLEGIPVDDAWLEQMSVLTNLEKLNLFNTHVSGSGFRPFKHHSQLRRVDLFVAAMNKEFEAIELDLEPLSQTGIQELQLSGHFDKKSLEPLTRMGSLQELRLTGGFGFSDDSLINLLKPMSKLRRLMLEDNCTITDRGAHELAQFDQLQHLSVSGFVTQDGVAALSAIPSLRQLVVNSSNVPSTFKQDFPKTFVREFTGDVDQSGAKLKRDDEKGADGFLRRAKFEGIEKVRSLEGAVPPRLQLTEFGPGADFKFEDYRGKVVLLEFWGTWCGPCLRQITKLKKLHDQYHAQGLEIVSVHSTNGANELAGFLEKKPLPWIKLVDRDNLSASSFHVPHYPSFYLIDKQGTLRVALAHEQGLEDAIVDLVRD